MVNIVKTLPRSKMKRSDFTSLSIKNCSISHVAAIKPNLNCWLSVLACPFNEPADIIVGWVYPDWNLMFMDILTDFVQIAIRIAMYKQTSLC
jgi:hypothetical protein